MAKSARLPHPVSFFVSQRDRDWIAVVAEENEASISEVMRATVKLARENRTKVDKLLER